MKQLRMFGLPLSFLLAIPLAHAQCPAVNSAPGCNAVITVASDGTFSVAGVPANGTNYDGSDDALFGIVNNSTTPLSNITLDGSSVAIFGFEDDGIDTFGVPGNALDTTGYGGPNAYFTNISSDSTMGTVNFLNAVAANGGTSYFSLEESFDANTPPVVTGGGSSVTPEPSSLLLLGTGALGLAGAARRRMGRQGR